MLKRTLICTILALGVLAPAAAAAPPTSETISFAWQIDSFPSHAPYEGTATGSFSASGSFTDSGTMAVSYHLGAVPSPSVGVLHTKRTLIGQLGTITLRCNQLASDFSNPAAVPNSGHCTVIDATGAYAGIHGEGTITGVGDLAASPATLTDTLVLSEH
jgi:hypothetical protein